MINDRLNNYGGKYVKTSINIRPNELNFIKSTGYSVTAVFRKAMNDLMNDKLHEDVNELAIKIERMGKIIQQQSQFVEDKGLSEQFGEFQDLKEEEELMRHKKKQEKPKKTPEEEVKEVFSK